MFLKHEQPHSIKYLLGKQIILGTLPVSIICDAHIGGGLQDARHGTDGGEHLAPELTQCEPVEKRVVDEDGRFRHHRKIGDGQVDDEYI
jgi:hypothetical protein